MNVYHTAPNTPCYNEGNDCPDRTFGCHSTCPKYLEWLEENKKLHDKIQQEVTIQADARAYSVGIHQKLAKIRNQAKSKKDGLNEWRNNSCLLRSISILV